MRHIAGCYIDPLDQIWLTTAARIGLRIERSSEVYASTDGRGTLRIGTPDILDADDSVAQMIFHELCHSLVEGAHTFAIADWGLDNTSAHHAWREHACLRLQAALAAEYGLRRFFAPTTDFRGFYDQLGELGDGDPLQPRFQPSVAAAILALQRADTPPWSPHLRAALAATAAIAAAAAPFAGDQDSTRHGGDDDPGSSDRPPLWQLVEPLPAPHPSGLAGARDGGPERSCGTCAWRFSGGRGRAVDRCRQAGDVRVDPAWPACARWEPLLECQACGACCRAAYDSVTVSRRDAAALGHPELIVDRGSYIELRRISDPAQITVNEQQPTRCAALGGGRCEGDGGFVPYACAVYEQRPRPCRDFEQGSANCLHARRRVGLSR